MKNGIGVRAGQLRVMGAWEWERWKGAVGTMKDV
jgi:hypothetical protein